MNQIFRIEIKSVRYEEMNVEAATIEQARVRAQRLIDNGREVIDTYANQGEPADNEIASVRPLSDEDGALSKGNADENAEALVELIAEES